VIAAILPLLASLGKKSGIAKALLLGIPLAAATGGIGTIIGTPPNAIGAGALKNAGIIVEFLDWMKFGIPVSVALTSIACMALIRIYIKDTTPISLDFLENQALETGEDSTLKRNIVAIVIIITVGLWLTTSLHGLTVASICAVPLVVLTVTRVLEGKDIQGLPWDTLLLVAGGLSLGLALEQTGLLNHYAEMLIALKLNTMVLIFIFAYLTMLVSNIMSNTAASTVMIPLGMAILPDLKLEIAMIIAISSSTAMFLPVSTPPNAIAFSTGLLGQKDFRLGGILVGLLGPLLAILWVMLVT
jgi:sodium-dependent dicarboxylate transporter 2/3/5